MEEFKTFVIIISTLMVTIILIIIGINTVDRKKQKNIKEYIDKGYERSIVMIDTNNKITEILIKKDSELVDAIKKELLKKEK